MELTDRWNAMNWQTSEFSYAKVDLLAELKNESKSDITKLLNSYKQQYVLMLVMTVVTPLVACLKTGDPDYVFSIGIVWSYCLVLSGFLTVKYARFKLPDLSLQTADAIRALLVFVGAINSFQNSFDTFYRPVVFVGSVLVMLTYRGKRLATIVTDPFAVAVIVSSMILIIWSQKAVNRFMSRRQCGALRAKLEEHLRMLEQP